MTYGFLLISNDRCLWICVENIFWHVHFFPMITYVCSSYPNDCNFSTYNICTTFLKCRSFSHPFRSIPREIENFFFNVYLPIYVMRTPTIPNSVLSTKPIANLHCSLNQYNAITIQNSHFYTIWGYQNHPRPHEQVHRKLAINLVP